MMQRLSNVKSFTKVSRPLTGKRAASTTKRNMSVKASEASGWAKEDNRRMLHAVYRIGDMDKTIEYYKKHFGMELLRHRDVPDDKYTNAFMGYGSEKTHFSVELTYNYGQDSYDIGEGFGHFGLAVEDVFKTVESVKSAGGKVTRDAGPVKGGKTNIAFVEDPTGYKFELIQRPATSEPFAQVNLRVKNLDESIKYYTECLGMKLLRTRENPENKYTLAFLAYGPEEENTVFELTYNHGKDDGYSMGDAYAQVAISTDDVYKTAEAIREKGGKITKEPGELKGQITTKIMATTDPDGYKIVFVDNEDFLKELE